MKKENANNPVSLAVYRQLVFDCAAELMSADCDKAAIATRLIALADTPVKEYANEDIHRIVNTEKSCANCRKYTPTFDAETSFACACGYDTPDAKNCDDYNSRHMEFPMAVGEIVMHRADTSKHEAIPVAVRLAGDDDAETYLGFMLDGVTSDFSMSYNRATKELNAFVYNIPTIFVPKLGRVVYGHESWWRRIKSEADLREITNEDISGQWYIVALRALSKAEEE